MKPVTIGKVFFAKEGYLFPVTPIKLSLPKNFRYSREDKKNSTLKKAKAVTKKIKRKK